MLTAGKESQTLSTVFARVLVVVTETVHVLVTALAIADATRKRSQSPFGFFFDFAQIHFRNTILQSEFSRWRGWSARDRCIGTAQGSTETQIPLPFSFTLFPLQ